MTIDSAGSQVAGESPLRLRLLISYDGTDYCGWQRQTHEKRPSLQETLERALSRVFNQPIAASASGRTDAGVHALGQVCHFDVHTPVSRFAKWNLCYSLQSQLPSTVVVRKAWLAPADFHATVSAVRKTYRYWVYHRAKPSAVLARFSHWHRYPLDLNFLNQCAQQFVGEHDFKSFQSVGTPIRNTVRTIHYAGWSQRPNGLIEFKITGNGFLKQMVRNIVGTQLMVLKKGQPPGQISEILAARDRQAAGAPAPAQGLFLVKVYYPRAIDIQCREL